MNRQGRNVGDTHYTILVVVPKIAVTPLHPDYAIVDDFPVLFADPMEVVYSVSFIQRIGSYADALLTESFDQLLSKSVLQAPEKGCIHALWSRKRFKFSEDV